MSRSPTIRVNGELAPYREESVADLLDRLGHPRDRRGIAVAVNEEVVPRGHWSERHLAPGDRVEIVGAVQGG